MKYQLAIIASLVAIANASAAGSSVTVYGSIDGGLRNLSNSNAAGDSLLTMGSNGTFRSNRLGFKGVEDLGNGLAANFVLESGFNTGTGALNNTTNILFQRESHVGLSLGGQSVDLGNQYTIAYKTALKFDPFLYRYPSITYALSAAAGTRKTNDIQYTGKFGDVTAMAEYALGEIAGSTRDGSTGALGAIYERGPLKLGASYTSAKQNVGTATLARYMDYSHYNLGGSYTVGAAQFAAGYVSSVQKTATTDTTNKWSWAGLNYALTSQLAVTGAWYQNKAFNTAATAAVAAGDAKKNLYMAGLTYNFSARTNLYAEVDVNKLDGGYATGGTTKLNQSRQTGMSAGIMHMF
ncbi:MAG: porin [Pseudomonadota bacterium]